MTNQQLYTLLETLRSELNATIEETDRHIAVYGTEREQKIIPVNDDGTDAIGFARLAANITGKVRYEDDPHGAFVALQPLTALAGRWAERFDILLGDDE